MKTAVTTFLILFCMILNSCVAVDEDGVSIGSCGTEILDVTPNAENYTFRVQNGSTTTRVLTISIEYLKDGIVVGDGESVIIRNIRPDEVIETTTTTDDISSTSEFDCIQYDVVTNGVTSVCTREGTSCQ